MAYSSSSVGEHLEKYKKACLEVDTGMERVIENVMQRVDGYVRTRRDLKRMSTVNEHAFDDVRLRYEDVQKSLADCVEERERHTRKYYSDRRDDGHETRKAFVAKAAIEMAEQRIKRDCRFDGSQRVRNLDAKLKTCEGNTGPCDADELGMDIDAFERDVERCKASTAFYEDTRASMRRYVSPEDLPPRVIVQNCSKSVPPLRSRLKKLGIPSQQWSDVAAIVEDATAATESAIDALTSLKPLWSDISALHDVVERLWDAFDKHERLHRALNRVVEDDHKKAMLQRANKHAVLFIRRALSDVLYDFHSRTVLVKNEAERQSASKCARRLKSCDNDLVACQNDLDDYRLYLSKRRTLKSHPVSFTSTKRRRHRTTSSS